MAITIEWATGIISVPKADLTLIQASPTEIREMNLNWFRLELKALEAAAEGMGFLRTHNHNTEVTLGALTFARVIEIINGYTVTFEDGQYAVDLVGANSNVGDVTNVNQVSVRSYNSAGLISSPAIEYASFNGGVIIDQYSGISGTVFPRGTEQMKVDNITDALLIAQYRGFNKIYFHSSYQVDSGADLSNFICVGESYLNTDIEILTTADVTGATFVDCLISGVLDGGNVLDNCVVGDLEYVNGHIRHSGLTGTIELAGSLDAFFSDCHQVDINLDPVIDMGGSGQDLVMTNFSGIICINNLTGGNKIGIGLDAGRVCLDSADVTSGTIHVSGVGDLIDENGDHIYTGTWNGGVTIINELINKVIMAEAIWQSDPADYMDADTIGQLINMIPTIVGLSGENVKWSALSFDANHLMTAATITYYTDNTLVTPVKAWDITAAYDGDGEMTSYEMVEV